jgi:hypothetical protein
VSQLDRDAIVQMKFVQMKLRTEEQNAEIAHPQ